MLALFQCRPPTKDGAGTHRSGGALGGPCEPDHEEFRLVLRLKNGQRALNDRPANLNRHTQK